MGPWMMERSRRWVAGLVLIMGAAGCGDDTAGADDGAGGDGSDATGGPDDGGDGAETADDGADDTSGDGETDSADSTASGTPTDDEGGSDDTDSDDTGSDDTGGGSSCEYGHVVEHGSCDVGWELWGTFDPVAMPDLDGDADLDLAARRRDEDGNGIVQTLSGMDGATLNEHDAGGPVTMMRRVGDLDGDTLDDLVIVIEVVEEPEEGGVVGSGGEVTTTVRALSSSDLSELWHVTHVAEDGLEEPPFVTDVAPASELSGDAIPDIKVGRGGNPGFVATWSGADGSLVAWHGAPAGADFDFPNRVLDASDLDGDGIRDHFVTAFGTLSCFACGAVWAMSGLDGTVMLELIGEPGQLLGNELAVADLDDDSIPELLVGDFYHSIDTGGVDTPLVGELLVFDPLSGSLLWSYEGIADEHDYLGISVGPVGDLDGDGVAEVAAAAHYPPVDPVFGPPGRLVLLSGADGERMVQVRDAVEDPMTTLSTMLGAGTSTLSDGAFAVSAPRTECDGEESYLARWACSP